MFYKKSDAGFKPLLPGIQMKTLVYGDKSSLTAFFLGKDSELPWHAHPHEQTGYLLSGHIRLTVGEEVYDTEPGDSWCVPGGMQHRADILEDSFAIEVFSPVREDYLPGK
jgi:quercetin dioxygenase-like cupin family protein